MMRRPDRTDYGTYAAVTLLAAVLAFVLAARPAGSPVGDRNVGGGTTGAADPERMAIEQQLGHFPPVGGDREKLAAFLRTDPGNSRAHFSLGELAYRSGSLAEAVPSFRRALELNRSYADRTSPLHQGELLGRVVDEGLRVYQREKELRPEDERVRETIKDLYFIRRSLAGGCD